MTGVEIFNKTARVIGTCTTLEQLQVASVYFTRARKRMECRHEMILSDYYIDCLKSITSGVPIISVPVLSLF